MKSLATQTAHATNEINKHISAIQAATAACTHLMKVSIVA
ncbi:hypothetical protein [Bradyrhizobium australiense]|nr:hypothetical protein [Bradyrhizobium australiense]